MLFDLKHKDQQIKAHEYFMKLSDQEQPIELKRVAPKRSNLQNRYFHALINLFAIEYGDRVDYVKQDILKKIACPHIFKTEHVNKKTGEIREDWRSTASLDSEEMSKVIDHFRTWSVTENGIHLPSAEEYKTDWITYLQTIENNREYL